ncbi:MAG: CHAT domain-containing protein [Flavobacteriales bacterium]|nr:CHAT domain-containing protein [Flavobacteriales bacterium]
MKNVLVMCVAQMILSTLWSTDAIGQKRGQIQFRGNTSTVVVSNLTIDSLKKQVMVNDTDTYKEAWLLCTLSEMYLLMNNPIRAEEYFHKAISELSDLPSESAILCVLEMGQMASSMYKFIPDKKRMDTYVKLNDFAINLLVKHSRIAREVDEKLIYLLISNAVTTWKYDHAQATNYFEKLRLFSESILRLGRHESIDPFLFDMLKNGLRRYVRFMNGQRLSSTQTYRDQCESIDCVDKAWGVMQSLKSRILKEQLLHRMWVQLNEQDRQSVSKCYTFLDSVYGSESYYGTSVEVGSKENATLNQTVDSVNGQISSYIPEFTTLNLNAVRIDEIERVLTKNETYISVMYTDNKRNVYAWKIEKGMTPVVIKLDINSLEMFARIEYFRSRLVTDEGSIKVLLNDTVSEYGLEEYMSFMYALKMEPVSNAGILYDKLIRPLAITPKRRVILEVDQNLGALPIGLLKNPKTQRLFLEDHPIVYTPCASLFYLLRNDSLEREHASEYIGFSYNDRNSYVDTIIQKSSQCFNVASHTNFQTSESKVYELDSVIKDSKYIHFACHSKATDSGICLMLDSENGHDGRITADDVLKYVKNDADLTALTSCSTSPNGDDHLFIDIYQEGEQLHLREGCVCNLGETFSNLTGAFFAAGSRKMLVTQWDIPDSDISANFMSEFFCYLSDETAETALQRTQDNFKGQHVRYWGGYILVGD